MKLSYLYSHIYFQYTYYMLKEFQAIFNYQVLDTDEMGGSLYLLKLKYKQIPDNIMCKTPSHFLWQMPINGLSQSFLMNSHQASDSPLTQQ